MLWERFEPRKLSRLGCLTLPHLLVHFISIAPIQIVYLILLSLNWRSISLSIEFNRFFDFCRVTFVIAEICLLAGSVRNAYHTKYRTIWSATNPPSCEILRKGVFGAGAAFIVFTGIISELYYVSFSRANHGNAHHGVRDTGVRMGTL